MNYEFMSMDVSADFNALRGLAPQAQNGVDPSPSGRRTGRASIFARDRMPIESLSETELGPEPSEPASAIESDTSSNSLRWRALSQRIWTFAQVPVEVAILDTDAAPAYQQIVPKVVRLRQLGPSNLVIAKRLRITDKTAAKSVAWLWRVQHRPDG